jgi:PKHD-type hydroxylase
MGEGFPNKRVYYIPSKLPKSLIDPMRDYCDHLEYGKGEVFGDSLDPNAPCVVRDSVRRSEVSWINFDEWIPSIMWGMVYSANELYFKYDLRHFNGSIQSTVYRGETNSFYGWHVDGGKVDELNGVELERKLSISLILSEPDEYEGGELQFSYYTKNHSTGKPPAGTAVIFPAWVPHRVRPVKSGVRRSLVAWIDGPLFK